MLLHSPTLVSCAYDDISVAAIAAVSSEHFFNPEHHSSTQEHEISKTRSTFRPKKVKIKKVLYMKLA